MGEGSSSVGAGITAPHTDHFRHVEELMGSGIVKRRLGNEHLGVELNIDSIRPEESRPVNVGDTEFSISNEPATSFSSSFLILSSLT